MAGQFFQKYIVWHYSCVASDICNATMNFKISGVKGSETEFLTVLNRIWLFSIIFVIFCLKQI